HNRCLMPRELEALAETLAEWISPAPGIPAVYLFGSRVRGDHRPDSDVDVRLHLHITTQRPLRAHLAGGDRTACLGMSDSKCAGRPARSRWCKSTTMKE